VTVSIGFDRLGNTGYAAQEKCPTDAQVNGTTTWKEGMDGWVVCGEWSPGLSFPSSHAWRPGSFRLAEGLLVSWGD
jgi:hypothetical protein